ncbi:MAG: response regulator [Lentisphaeria bacterium]
MDNSILPLSPPLHEPLLGLEERILVVDDSRTQAAMLHNLLTRNGYAADMVFGGPEACDYLARQRPAMVVSDIVMPEMDGYALCRRIKKDPATRGVPVILLTTLSDVEDIVRGLDSGADNFIVKPYDEEALLAQIQYVLVNRRLRKVSGGGSSVGIEVYFAGKRHYIQTDRIQILDLLLSTYDKVVRQYREMEALHRDLDQAHEEIRTLSGLLPMCAGCKKIRDDKNGQWEPLEKYLTDHSAATVSHSLCPACQKQFGWDKVSA